MLIRRPVPGTTWIFYSVDYSGGELVTFAESCKQRLGFSRMGEALKRGVDVHSALAATALGVTYEHFLEMLAGKHGEAAKDRAKRTRQAMKPENFGNPGGMGAAKAVLTQRKQGPDTPHPSGPSEVDDGTGKLVPGYKGLRFCILAGADRCGAKKVTEWRDRPIPPTCLACLEAKERGREVWFRQWPEARPYLDWHAQNVDEVGEVEQIYTRRIRGGVDFCSEANGDFQALLADIAKRALCRVTLEQYVRTVVATEPGLGFKVSAYEGQVSPLYGNARGTVFAHDELLGECRREVGHECAGRVVEVMVEEFIRGCPNHREACKAEWTLMPRWYKAAAPVIHDDRLVEWTPQHDPKTCPACADQRERDAARNKARG